MEFSSNFYANLLPYVWGLFTHIIGFDLSLNGGNGNFVTYVTVGVVSIFSCPTPCKVTLMRHSYQMTIAIGSRQVR